MSVPIETAKHNPLPEPLIAGILNITADSFSDGGLYLNPERALIHGSELSSAGAAVLDLGAASSHPDAAHVGASEEMRRLEAVIDGLQASGHAVAVDSFEPEVQRFAMAKGVAMLNDIQGFPHPEIYTELASFPGKLVVMHSIQHSGIATRTNPDYDILDMIEQFFDERLSALTKAGVDENKIILDPGMGFFLGTDPELSLRVLRNLPRLKEKFARPLYVSVSRKSFLGTISGRSVNERGAISLSTELFAAAQGVDYIRTHDVAALHDGLLMREKLEGG